ncbi:MAG: GNAT family N-acetyltransferase, partial [Candidatus Thorarchaeota archaeon]
MVDIEIHSFETFDVEALTAFTLDAYSDFAIPYKYGSTNSQIQDFFKDKTNCPDFIAIAKEENMILGWAGLYHWTDSMSYLLSWHPLVRPFDSTVGIKLLQECINYSEVSGRDRMEVFLMNLTESSRGYASKCGDEYYLPVGMKRGFEWVYMEADLSDLEMSFPQVPSSMVFRSLDDISNDDLWPSYDHAFSTGGDRRYADQSEAQRRENFDSFFSRKVPFDKEASLVLIDQETIVGFVKIDQIDEGAYVHGVAIIPEYRSQGLGK